MNNATRIVTLGFSVLMLASCGGGGSGGSDTQGGSDTPSEKNFSVSLKNVDIRRVSNEETVDIDTSRINGQQMVLK